jgi:hypothetical protein
MTYKKPRQFPVPWPLWIALAALGGALWAEGAARLAPGSDMPLLEATTLSGDSLALPRDARGRPAIVVIGFSKAAAAGK